MSVEGEWRETGLKASTKAWGMYTMSLLPLSLPLLSLCSTGEEENRREKMGEYRKGEEREDLVGGWLVVQWTGYYDHSSPLPLISC